MPEPDMPEPDVMEPDMGGPDMMGPNEVPVSEVAQEELAQIDPVTLTLDAALARFDVNLDGVIDAGDLRDVRLCIEAEEDIDGMRCDVVADGAIDAQDAYALSMVVGESLPRAEASVALVVDALEAEATLGADSELLLAFHDYTQDGTIDGDDIGLLAALLDNDPNTQLDFDGDGALGFSDVLALARTGAENGDLNNDGTVGSVDLLLLAHAATYAAEQSFGLLDVNLDARIDTADFCATSPAPADASLYGALMRAEVAEAAFADGPPRFEVCRADGRAIARQVPDLGVPMVLGLRPDNLYLKPIETPGIDPVLIEEGDVEGRALLAITTEPTDWPVLEINMPWSRRDPVPGGMLLEIGGEPLPDNASIVLPSGVAPLSASARDAFFDSAQSAQPRVRGRAFEFNLDGLGVAPAQREDAGLFFDRLNATIDAYDSVTEGCPCGIPEEARRALVRNILQVSQSLDTILAVSSTVLATLESAHRKLAHLTQVTNSAVAFQFNLLADEIVAIEVIKTLLLIAETGYDIAVGGLGNGLAGAVGNLISEIEADFVLPEQENGALQLGQNTLASLSGGLPAGLVNDAFEAVTARLAAEGGGAAIGEAAFRTAFIEEFTKIARTKLNDRGGLGRNVLETFIKELIKVIPVLYLRHVERLTFAENAKATEIQAAYSDSVFLIGRQRNVIRRLTAAKVIVDRLKERFFDALDANGCPAVVTTERACDFDLQTTIEDARVQLIEDIFQTRTALDNVVEETGPDALFQSTCVEGEVRRSINIEKLEVAGVSRELTQLARLRGPQAAIDALGLRLERATGALAELKTQYAQLGCAQLFALDLTQEQVEALQTAETNRTAAFATFEQTVLTALTTYTECAGGQGGECGVAPALAIAAPWTAAAQAVACLPAFTMECCGDGRQQSFEECDASDAIPLTCDDGMFCNEVCACETIPDEPIPQEFYDLGAGLGLSAGDIDATFFDPDIDQIIHSAPFVPPRPVANDHTTLGGMAWGTVFYDAEAATGFDAQFPCGPGDFGHTLCGPNAGQMGTGSFHVLMTGFEGTIPLSDPPNLYQYGAVFDANGNAIDNYLPPQQFANDYFQNTDTWFVVTIEDQPALSIIDGSTQGFPALDIDARVVISGDMMAWIIPADAIETDDPAFRATAFRHTGDFGFNSPFNYDGSLFPSVADGLLSFSGNIAQPALPDGYGADPRACLLPPFPLALSDTDACIGDGIIEVFDDATVTGGSRAIIRVPAGEPLRYRVKSVTTCDFSIVSEARFSRQDLEGGLFVPPFLTAPGTPSDTMTIDPSLVQTMADEDFIIALWTVCDSTVERFGSFEIEIVP